MDVCIVYFSSTVEPFETENLPVILEESHRNNVKSGVTGVMLYVRGRIVQVLEGEQETVERLFRSIERDGRHTDVSRILTRPITQRLFGSWLMGYETITDRQLAEINAVVNLDDRDGAAVDPHDNIILKTIRVFYETNRYN